MPELSTHNLGDDLPPTNPPPAEAEALRLIIPASAGVRAGSRYTILQAHARGGLGEVFRAADTELGREVALKCIQERHRGNRDSVRRFLFEAAITARLEHPGIVPIHGLVYDADGQPSYAMRFIEGESLDAAIKHYHDNRDPVSPRSRVSEGERRVRFRQLLQRFVAVCQTMSYAHSKGVIHRDLKPANVMLGPFGETLVVDWGLAKELVGRKQEAGSSNETLAHEPSKGAPDESAQGSQPATMALADDATQIGVALGTPQFMAPEQAAGRWDVVGPGSDIYSLGAILYVLITGELPFPSPRASEVFVKVNVGEFPPPRQVQPDVPKPLEAICLKAMALKPEDRYASTKELAADVEHWLADEPVSAYGEPWPVRAGRWMRRHRAMLTGGVAVLMALTVSLAVGAGLLEAANGQLREANSYAEFQRLAAVASAERAANAQERAEQGFAKAQEAVERYLTAVTEDPDLKHKHDLHAVRKKLLGAAVPFYEWFAEQNPGEAEWEAERGRAYGRLALVRDELGEKEAALTDQERKRSIFAKLAANFPAIPQYRHDLATSHNSLGNLLRELGQRSAAEQAYRRALELQQQLAAEFPTVAQYRQNLAGSHNNLGLLLIDLGQRPAAQTAFHRALEIREKLAADFPTVSEFRRELATSHHNQGILLAEIGQWAAAEQAYRRAQQLREALVAESPTVPQYRQELASSYNGQANVLGMLGEAPATEQAYRRALAIREQLAADFASVPQYRLEVATNYNDLGILLRHSGRQPLAEQAYRRGLDVLEKLATEFPDVPKYRPEMARTHRNLGTLLESVEQREPAEQSYRRSLDVLEKLVAEFPTMIQYRRELAGTYSNLGNLLRSREDGEASLACYAKAIALLEPLVKRDARLVTERRFLRNTHLGRAMMLADLARHTDAVKDWDRALELNAVPRDEPGIRTSRAQSLARAGEHFKAVAEANALAADKEVPGDALFDLACICALASAAVKDDAKLADQYAARAALLLRQAIAKGYKDIEHLKKDDDLKALREREDFQKLVKELEGKIHE